MKRIMNHNQQGAVAIFIVIFAALFITIITISFVGIMLKNQTQSVNADLADSAYDSALAGVEDAKRLFQSYKQCEAQGFLPEGCEEIRDAITAECFAVKKFITQNPEASGETTIQRTQQTANSEDSALDQAYTCVSLKLNVDYREGSIDAGKSGVIPIALKDGNITKITISWFDKAKDNGGLNAVFTPNSGTPLPATGSWPAQKPSVLRVQLVNLSSSFNLTDFDQEASGRKTGTVFLYPAAAASTVSTSILPPSAPITRITCSNTAPLMRTVGNAEYFCTAELTLPVGGINASPTSYLIINPIYRNTHFAVQAFSGTTPLIFTNVANVDATGRANDIFRRVSAQIELDTSGGGTSPNYPTAALEVRRLCKNFSVTDRGQDFSSSGCTP